MGLSSLDLGVIAVYLAAVTLFGLRFRRRKRTLKDYFLAGNSAPWWAISLSIVAAETSTLTIISVPGLAYDKDFRFLQLVFGYLVGRIIVSFLLIPQYFRGGFVTAYQLMERRFGPRMRALTGGIFLLTRAAAEGVRVFAVAIVIRIALGSLLKGMTDLRCDACAIAIVTLLTLLYTFEGGMAAVIWTDVVQLAIYIAGAIIGFFVILHLVPAGWATVSNVAGAAAKFRIFDLSWNLTSTYTLWSGIIGGAIFTMASHGTDQLIVQRLLSARTEKQSQIALISSGVAVLFQFTLFPTFIVNHIPHGLCGLLIAAILAAAMSNLSAALNSLSSTTIVDFYAHFRPKATEERCAQLSRISTVIWAFILFGLAMLARHGGRVLEMGLSIASVAYGSLLGVFLLGVLTRKASESGAMIGMIVGLAVNLYLWVFTKVSFTWYVLFGSMATFIVGYGASCLVPQSSADRRAREIECN